MLGRAREHYQSILREIEESGLYKSERIIRSPQGARIEGPTGEVLNFCANNYLGLSNAPEILKAAHEGLDARPQQPTKPLPPRGRSRPMESDRDRCIGGLPRKRRAAP